MPDIEIPEYPVEEVMPHDTENLICKKCMKQTLLIIKEHDSLFDGLCISCGWECWNIIPEYYKKRTEQLLKDEKKEQEN